MVCTLLSSLSLAILLNGHLVASRNLKAKVAEVLQSDGTSGHQTIWYQAILPKKVHYTLPTGEGETLHPKCSGAPIVDRSTGRMVAFDEAFSFLFEPGEDLEKLLIYLPHGGICTDAESCVRKSLGNQQDYTRSVDIDQFSEDITGGMFDDHEDGPYNDYSKVYIPACTGDMFLGSKDTYYEYSMGRFAVEWTIHHRGMDNVLATLYWLKEYGAKYGIDLTLVKDVSLIGAGTSGMGAPFLIPYLEPHVEGANVNLVTDGGINVPTKGFYTTAIYNPEEGKDAVWGFESKFPTWAGFNENFFKIYAANPSDFQFRVYLQLARSYANVRLADVTSNQDKRQITLYNSMLAMDGTEVTEEEAATLWYGAINRVFGRLGFLAVYKTYMEDGDFSDSFITSDLYYNNGSAGGKLVEWNKCMIERASCWGTVKIAP